MAARGTSSESILDIEVVRRLSKVSTARWLAAAFGDWAMIGAAIYASLAWPHWLVYLGAIVLIGTRQHALGVLMHEGVHRRIAPNNFWNDFLSDYLTGYMLLTPTEGYRAFHLRHHQTLDTPEDPERITVDRFEREWSFPMSRARFWWLLLRDLSGLWPKPALVLLTLIWDIPGRRIHHVVRIAVLFGAVASLLAAAGHLWVMFVFWWLPLFTVFPACFRLRTVAEHSGIAAGQPRYTREESDVVGTTRTTVSNPVGRFFIGSHGINYHTEHHLYPSVPYFHLREIHESLRSDPEFAAKSHTALGYGQVISEMTGAGENVAGGPARRWRDSRLGKRVGAFAQVERGRGRECGRKAEPQQPAPPRFGFFLSVRQSEDSTASPRPGENLDTAAPKA